MGHASYGNNSDQEPANAVKPDPAAKKPQSGQGKAGPAGGGAEDVPAAGPHAEPELTNPEATPGAGTLPEAGDSDGSDATSG